MSTEDTTVENFDAYLRRYEYKSADEAMFSQFAETIEHDLNQKPRIHPTLIATQFRSNGSITGCERRAKWRPSWLTAQPMEEM